MPAYDENGPDGVAQVINKMNDELKALMIRTGSSDPRHIDPSVIHYAPWIK